MPCNSGYLGPNDLELKLSHVRGLLDEVETGAMPDGFGPRYLDDRVVEDVRTIIRRGKRLSDPEYLARIVFDQMTLGRQGQDTGAGIGATQHGDIDILVTIDTTKRTVRVDDIWEKTSTTQTFQEFAQ